jgi:uncharacterized protein (TIGR02266 family)
MTKANVLVVEVGPHEYDEIAPPLLRSLFDVDRIPGAASALDLLTAIPFAAIICKYPLRDLDARDFLAAIRKPGSASADAAVAFVAEPDEFETATPLLEVGANLVLSLDEPEGEREAMLCALFGIQPRRSMRVLVKLMVIVNEGQPDRFVSQTHDISASGMFVATRKAFPVGTRARFQFALPGESRPFQGVSEVKRCSDRSNGGPNGMGMRFVDFDIPGDAERLDERLTIMKT